MTKILECLEESNGNYVLPFFWQHGESEEVLRSYMRAIHGANIQAVCLEARPHPNYAGEGWFHDVDIILDEAKKLDMKIWILDDAHFPSGQCGGKMLQESVELQKQYLKYRASELTGFPVFFVEKTPDHTDGFQAVLLEQLPNLLEKAGLLDAVTDVPFADLQIYHYSQRTETYYLISNESGWENYQGKITLPVKGIPFLYDAMKNTLSKIAWEEKKGRITLPFTIEPYEMKIIVVPADASIYQNIAENITVIDSEQIHVSGPWKLSFIQNQEYPDYTDQLEIKELVNIVKIRPDFSGIIRYETTFYLADASKAKMLELEEAYESAEVWINKKYAGECICPPYRYMLKDLCVEGENKLRIEVRTTLEREVNRITGGKNKYGLPPINTVYPQGLIGKVRIVG